VESKSFFHAWSYEWQTSMIILGTRDRWQWSKSMEGISFIVNNR
jgi:hypothetical protein